MCLEHQKCRPDRPQPRVRCSSIPFYVARAGKIRIPPVSDYVTRTTQHFAAVFAHNLTVYFCTFTPNLLRASHVIASRNTCF